MPQSYDLFLLVRSWDQAKILLEIRNDCREGMTHHTEEITLNQQKVFFDKHLHPEYGDGRYRAYLLIHNNVPVGYGGLRLDGNKYWMTIGVHSVYRGRGYSRKLIELITKVGAREGKAVWLDCWIDNYATKGYFEAGYKTRMMDKIGGRIRLTMKYEGK